MGKVFALAGGKGGAGATSAAAHLAVSLARGGRRVCLIDASVGLRHLDAVLKLESRILFDLVDVAMGNARLRHALVKDAQVDNLYLLPSPQTRLPGEITPVAMKEVLAQVRAEFDYVLVDSPPGMEQGYRVATAGADVLVLLTEPVVTSLEASARAAELFRKWRAVAPVLLLVNHLRPHLAERGEAPGLPEIQQRLPFELVGTVEHDAAFGFHAHPADMADQSRAARQYQALALRLAEGGALARIPAEREAGALVAASQQVAQAQVVFGLKGPAGNVFATLASRLTWIGLFTIKAREPKRVVYKAEMGGECSIELAERAEGLAEIRLFFSPDMPEMARQCFELFAEAELRDLMGPGQSVCSCPACGVILTRPEVEWFLAMRREAARCKCGADIPLHGRSLELPLGVR